MPTGTIAAGFGFGLSLIVAIGAQNAFVLRQGLRREHVGAIVVLCAMSDMILIAVGVGLIEQVTQVIGWIVPVLRFGGAAFLIIYGLLAARRALKPGELTTQTDGPAITLGAALATAAGLTWLNPHVYLDTVLLLGSIANSRPDRWWFGLGAMAASWVFFAALGFGARLLRPIFASKLSWRILDGCIALVMWAIAVNLIISGV
jgi:L-lysine exporter family protein LysE/ArgO